MLRRSRAFGPLPLRTPRVARIASPRKMLRSAVSRLRAPAAAPAVVSSRAASTLTQILDGSVWQLKSRKGALVGEDSNGNKYYENTGYQSGRHRWVEYADLDNYNTTSVPREWHGWLHHVDDEPGLTTRPVAPNEVTFLPAVSARSKDAGEVTAAQHFPKGHFLNKRGIRNWKRYTPWSPP